MSYLGVTSDDRVELAGARHLNKVSAVLGKSLVIVFRILACDPLVASHLCELCEELVLCDTVAHEYTLARGSFFAEKCEEDVLHAHIFILELVCSDGFGVHEDLVESSGAVHAVTAAGYLRDLIDL